MKANECDCCLYLAEDQEMGEFYCSMNFDQDELEKWITDRHASCPYFRRGDDYSIVRKQN